MAIAKNEHPYSLFPLLPIIGLLPLYLIGFLFVFPLMWLDFDTLMEAWGILFRPMFVAKAAKAAAAAEAGV